MTIKFGKDKSSDLFSKIAEEYAKKIKTIEGKNNTKNKNTQIRKFYDELLLWNNKINIASLKKEEREEKFKEFEPFIKMLKAKVAYAKAREYVDDNFKLMFDQCINEINSPESLKDAKFFLEAVIAYSKFHEKQ